MNNNIQTLKLKKLNQKHRKMMFLLQCPRCKNRMKYNSAGLVSEKNIKRCVYCGKNFSVRKNIVQKL